MFEIKKYDASLEKRWDRFICNRSLNGTFLQTRNFLQYHQTGKFKDASFLVMEGSTIVAVVPGHELEDEKGVHFYSHLGATFGGIVLDYQKYHVLAVDQLMRLLEEYFSEQNYTDVTLKQTPNIFSKKNMELFDYFFKKGDWKTYLELSFFVDLAKTSDEMLAGLSSSRRRAFRKSCQRQLVYKKILPEHFLEFYHILSENLCKFHTFPVHTLDELIEFKEKRLKNCVDFYGVYTEDHRLVAGTMLFDFGNGVIHTQYLAQSQKPEDLKLYAMEYLIFHTMLLAKEKGFRILSFGKSTEENGKILNMGLASFKEGFGCDYDNNKIFFKIFKHHV